ncbi:hypothetical protein [Gemmatimonas sp.]|uniref:hypothetical protein n=1 Tax=Gemmatimonas sp. TaxID=1962908 RepID=UPI00398365C6
MTPPRVVVYATSRPFRAACDGLLREAGARVRVASRQAELAKAIGEGTIEVVIAGDDGQDLAVARELAARSTTAVPVVQRAPGESIEEIVARALAVAATSVNQPRSSE